MPKPRQGRRSAHCTDATSPASSALSQHTQNTLTNQADSASIQAAVSHQPSAFSRANPAPDRPHVVLGEHRATGMSAARRGPHGIPCRRSAAALLAVGLAVLLSTPAGAGASRIPPAPFQDAPYVADASPELRNPLAGDGSRDLRRSGRTAAGSTRPGNGWVATTPAGRVAGGDAVWAAIADSDINHPRRSATDVNINPAPFQRRARAGIVPSGCDRCLDVRISAEIRVSRRAACANRRATKSGSES